MLLQCFTLHRLLLQCYDNTESSVRKASVFCLVAIYSVIGEELKPYLAELTGSKVNSLPVCQSAFREHSFLVRNIFLTVLNKFLSASFQHPGRKMRLVTCSKRSSKTLYRSCRQWKVVQSLLHHVFIHF